MERVPARDKYPKAKIEEPNLRLPKAMLKPDGDPNDDLCYMKIFEDDGRRAQHLAEAIAAGETLVRRVYRIRNNELVKFIGKKFEGMHAIHKASKATIGILSDKEANLHSHSYLDLTGTVEEVNTAEGLILDNILKTYSNLAYPVILMPPTIYGDYIIIPTDKVSRVVGTTPIKLLIMEMETGAWIKIEPGTPQETLINVFGPRENVIKGISLIRAVTYDPAEPSEAQEELWREYNEPHWRDFFKRHDEEEAKLKEVSGEPEKEKQAEEGGSGEPQTEKQKDDVKEAAGSKEAEKKKSKKLVIRLKKPGGGGSTQSKQTEGEGSLSQSTFLREKSPSEGSKQTEGEFKEPSWSQTFGHMKLEEDKQTTETKAKELSGESEKGQQEAEEGGSGVTEKEKQPEHVHKEDEDEKEKSQEEDVAKKNESEDEKVGDESKDKESQGECGQESVE